MSQLDLSVASGVTPRHVSFVETGRATPSRALLQTLADALEMPLRDRNDLFLAAGYAPPYRQLNLDDDEIREVRAVRSDPRQPRATPGRRDGPALEPHPDE